MNALQLLRQMHADTKVGFKLMLGSDDPKRAAAQWRDLQATLELHEQLEDECVYTPLLAELHLGRGTPLGDWSFRHEADVTVVQQLIQSADRLKPATPEWRTSIGTLMDALNKHVTDEEGQIFGLIDQVWGQPRLEEAGQRMQQMMGAAGSKQPAATRRTR